MGGYNTTEHINEVLNQTVAESATIATINELSKKVNVNDMTAYVMADAFAGNPSQLLGQVVEVRKKNGECPQDFKDVFASFEFSPFPVLGFKEDTDTKLKKPQLRGSVIVDRNISAKAGFLSYLNTELDDKSTFSLMIFDQQTGLIDFKDPGWTKGLKDWMSDNKDRMEDPEICYIYVVSGFVQKNIVRKKYIKFEAGAKGGAYGINIEGKLATSTEDYSLDIIFGLTPAIIKRPGNRGTDTPVKRGLAGAKLNTSFEPTPEELKLFASASGSTAKNAALQ